MFIFLWRFCRTSIDSALWGFLHCRDLIWARCVRCDSHCVFLGPVDNHMLQGNYPIEANMGGQCCHWDVTPLPMCVQTDSLFHYFVLHRECDEKMIHWRVQTAFMMNLRHICVCLSLCTFSSFISASKTFAWSKIQTLNAYIIHFCLSEMPVLKWVTNIKKDRDKQWRLYNWGVVLSSP